MVQKLLQENFFKEKPVIVMLCIPKNMNRFLEESVDEYKKSWNSIHVFEGIPNFDSMDVMEEKAHKVIVFDDLFQEMIDSAESKMILPLAVYIASNDSFE